MRLKTYFMDEKPPLEALPYGLLELDERAVVVGFSPVGERYSEVRARDVIGRDFFREIVPFVEAEEAEQRFRAFMERGDSHERFFFAFRSGQDDISVQVALAYIPGNEPPRFAIVRLVPATKEERR